jgi:GTPase
VTPNASLADRVLRGDRSALARLISWAENGDARFGPELQALYGRVGRAERIGVTGPPGSGKSTLVNELARLVREEGRTVGILAVDPSSPFTGGALLGDRIRMEERTLDAGVFIRSMATRGSHGGLARAAVDACDVMDAFGLATILIETVGVGQAEYDVLVAADTIVVVLCPGAGDSIQAMKAGLLEVADVLVVHKSDLPGADRLAKDLDEAVHVRFTGPSPSRLASRAGSMGVGDAAGTADRWEVPVVMASSATGDGVDGVLGAIRKHRAWLTQHDLERSRRTKRLEQLRRVVEERLSEQLWAERGLRAAAERELERGRAPHTVADALVARVLERLPALPPQALAGEGQP